MSQKNLPELSLLNLSPYRLSETEDGFVFDTDHGVTYALRFTDDSEYVFGSSFAYNTFSFSVLPVKGYAKKKDIRVADTIIYALWGVFEAIPEAVITYVCSLESTQERARSRLFHSWYLKTGEAHFTKFDYSDLENRIYTSVLFRNEHPHKDEINLIFEKAFVK
nr:DUF6169 family protein [uncultured Arsenicibacter sp.]